MFSNLKSAFQKAISKEIDESDDYGEDIQAIIILLLEACQIDGETEEIEVPFTPLKIWFLSRTNVAEIGVGLLDFWPQIVTLLLDINYDSRFIGI